MQEINDSPDSAAIPENKSLLLAFNALSGSSENTLSACRPAGE
ncbi:MULTISPECIES: hypothetical protein [unclassified Pantoea]|nr:MULTISPECIES: hypothetical protein [unclassified Pantoea]MDU6390663.1 hypothetical protein [Pantoea sp.]